MAENEVRGSESDELLGARKLQALSIAADASQPGKPSPEANQAQRHLELAAVLIMAGIGFNLIMAQFTWVFAKAAHTGEPAATHWPWIAGLICFAFAAFWFWKLTQRVRSRVDTSTTEPGGPSEISRRRYGRYVVGVTYFVLVFALMDAVSLAGFANVGVLDRVVPVTAPEKKAPAASSAASTPAKEKGKSRDGWIAAAQIGLGTGMTILGALLFFALALWKKTRADNVELFDHNLFWSGLWLRLGQAIVYTFVIFLVLRWAGRSEQSLAWLPILGLVVGLNIKGAQTFVMGLTERILRAVGAFIGSDPDPIPPTAVQNGANAEAKTEAPAVTPEATPGKPVPKKAAVAKKKAAKRPAPKTKKKTKR